MSFGGTQGGVGVLAVVSRVSVHRCESPDQTPQTETEYEIEVLGRDAESAACSDDKSRAS